MNKYDIVSAEVVEFTVFRAKGNFIDSIARFETIGEVIAYINQTPADQQWHITLSLKSDRTFPLFQDKPPSYEIVASVDGPDYRGCYYD